MLGATRRDPLIPAETDEERQHRFALAQSKKLFSIVTEITGHLGHWTDPKQSTEGLGTGTNRYEPSLRFAEAVADLRKLLLPSSEDGNERSVNGSEASEEVARLMETSGMCHKHLAPLLVTIPLNRHFASALHLGTNIYGVDKTHKLYSGDVYGADG